MIVETQSMTVIGVGAQKVQTEPGDTSLKLPNLILPTISLQEATQVKPDNGFQLANSFVIARFISRTNQVTATFTICTLSRGYWDLNISYTLKTTFAAPIPFNTNSNLVRLVSPIGGVSETLMTLNPIQSGYLERTKQFRLLLRDAGTIECVVDATGVGDFLDANVEICGVKLL